MIFEEYERKKRSFVECERLYNQAITEKENALSDKSYTKQKKAIETKIEELKNIYTERLFAFNQVAAELKESKDLTDKVYRLRYIERVKVRRIAMAVNYSEPQIYRILNTIRNYLENDKK